MLRLPILLFLLLAFLVPSFAVAEGWLSPPDPLHKKLASSVPEGMVEVPAGEFTMGSNTESGEKPIHQVHLDAFAIDKTEGDGLCIQSLRRGR